MGKICKVLALLGVIVTAGGCSSLLTPEVNQEISELQPGQYRIDARHSALLFKVEHLGLAQFVGRFNVIDATLDFSPEDMDDTRLDAIVETASVDVNDDKLDKMLRGGSWFDSENYPQAVFETLAVSQTTAKEFDFTGNLTFRGVTAPVTLTGVFNGGANNILSGKYTLGFSATGSFLRSQFGMDKYIPAVADEVFVEVHAEFIQQQ